MVYISWNVVGGIVNFRPIFFSHVFFYILFSCEYCSCNSIPFFHDDRPVVLHLNEGTQLQLHCQADAQPAPTYRWLRDGAFIRPSAPHGRLVIEAVSRKDAASYGCIAKNALGTTASNRTTVTVAYLDPFSKSSDAEREHQAAESTVIINPPPLDAYPLEAIRWTWLFNGIVIHSNLTHYISRDGLLVIVGPGSLSPGQYRVRAYHTELNREVSGPIITIVERGKLEHPKKLQKNPLSGASIVLSPRNATVLSHRYREKYYTVPNKLTLECVGVADPLHQLQLNWYHNGTLIAPSSHNRKAISDHSRLLVISNPRSSIDSGTYECEARHIYQPRQIDRQTAFVQIVDRPVFASVPPSVTSASLSDSIDIHCDIRPSASTRVLWYFNGLDITEHIQCCSPERNMVLLSTGALRINSVQQSSSGAYQCEPYNQAGSVLSTTWLRLNASQPTPATVGEITKTMQTDEGSSVTILCPLSNDGKQAVTWTLNGSPLLLDGSGVIRQKDSSLLISSVQLAHSGEYICGLSGSSGGNRVNSNQKAKIQLKVKASERLEITKGPSNRSVVIGSNIVFPCEVLNKANKTFIRRWLYKGIPVAHYGGLRGVTVRRDGSLNIRQVGPSSSGEYTCRIELKGHLEDEHSATLLVVEKPGMPLRVEASLQNGTFPPSVRVSWSDGFDGNSQIISYLAQYRFLTEPGGIWSEWEPIVENIDGQQRSIVVDNLKPSSSNEFRILALNKYGSGIPSIPSNQVTMPQQPPAAAPRSVGGSSRSSTSIMVQWKPPAEDQWNGDILGYAIRYRLADYADLPWIYQNISDIHARNYLLQGLITWREYEIQVAAYNTRGAGVFSKSQYVTTLEGKPIEAPSIVDATVINSTNVMLEWSPPSQQQIPGVNLGYKVQFWSGVVGQGQPFRQFSVVPNGLSNIRKNFGGLRKFASYNVTVLCYTKPGDGPPSTPVEVTTEEDIPDPVKELYLKEVLFSSVTLSWMPPSNPNGILKNYTLIYWETNQTSNRFSQKVAPESTSVKIGGLKPSTHYTFELFPSTSVGRGLSKTVEAESGVPPELPGAPFNLKVIEIGARSAKLQFRPGSNGKTLITNWLVQGQVGKSTVWEHIANISDPRAEKIILDGLLQPYTFYRLRLIAINVVGRSPSSEPSKRFETLQAAPNTPYDFSVRPESSTVLKASWTPLSLSSWNGITKRYVIFYTASDSSKGKSAQAEWKKMVVEDPHASVVLIQDLREFTMYDLYMLAENNVGTSNQTKTAKAQTYPNVPRESPVNVEARAESSTSMLVRWSPIIPAARNGDILGYRIMFAAERDGLPHIGETKVPQGETSYRLRDLYKYTVYQIQVVGFNQLGSSPKSQPPLRIRTMEDIPSQPVKLRCSSLTSSEARIRWDAPLSPAGVITSYQIFYGLNATGRSSDQEEVLNGDLRTYLAHRLVPQSWYRFAVRAKTGAGWGQTSVVYVFTSDLKIKPLVPKKLLQNFKLRSEARLVHLRWEPIGNQDAPDRYYTIQYQPANSDWQTYPEPVAGMVKKASIRGLHPNLAYKFRIMAVNDFGQSPWSAETEWIKTQESAPSDPPIHVKGSSYGSSSIRITWQAPSRDTWNSDSLGYRILYKEYRATSLPYDARELPLGSSDDVNPEYLLTNLKKFTDYLVTVQCFNRQGSSPNAKSVFVYVDYAIPLHGVTGLKAEATSSTGIKISWNRWEFGQSVSGFKVNYSHLSYNDADTVSSSEVDIATQNDTSLLLRDLQKYAHYNITVRAFNKAGDGPVEHIACSTKEDVPGPVTNLQFKDILLDSVNVTWDAPVLPNGKVIGYLVSYETFKLEQEYIKKIQEKVQHRYLLAANLEENVTYTFLVKAETAVGYGPFVKGTVTIGPQPGSPEAPIKPQLYVSPDSIELRWMAHTDAPDDITSYIIQYRTVDDQLTTNTIRRLKRALQSSVRWKTLARVDSSERAYVIGQSNLEPGYAYQFRVIASNQHGISYPSLASEAFIAPDAPAEPPWYLKWWFLVILALIGLLIIIALIAILCLTGGSNKYKYEKPTSSQSLHLADGCVTYELRTSKKWDQNRKQPPGVGLLKDDDFSTKYDELRSTAVAAPEEGNPTPPQLRGGRSKKTSRDPNHSRGNSWANVAPNMATSNSFSHPDAANLHSGQPSSTFGDFPAYNVSGSGALLNFSNQDHYFPAEDRADVESLSTSASAIESEDHDNETDIDPEISSMTHHYLTSNTDRADLSWRKAKQAVHRAAPPPRPPPSLNMVRGAQQQQQQQKSSYGEKGPMSQSGSQRQPSTISFEQHNTSGSISTVDDRHRSVAPLPVASHPRPPLSGMSSFV